MRQFTMTKDKNIDADEREVLELVRRAKGGDFEAFTDIVKRYQDRAYRLAWSLTRDDADAQDVVQEAFLNVYRKLDTFEGQAKFGSWLYRVVVNAALMRLRKRSRRQEVSLDDLAPAMEDLLGHNGGPAPWRIHADAAAENRELREKIIEAIEEMDPKYQVVFVLKEVEGLSLDEIATMLELTVPAVKTRLHRARLFLRATLERYLS